MNLANEGLEAKRKEEEVVQRKRKAEDDKSWEGALLLFFCIIPSFTSMTEQRVESTVLIVGDHSLHQARRRRRPR